MSAENEFSRFPVRKNPRLKTFDYTSHHYYFVTICTKDKHYLFGTPTQLSPLGNIAATCLRDIQSHFPTVYVDKWVIMPNHVHLILVLSGDGIALSTVIGQYKSAVTKQIRELYAGITIWQSSFHDHVIRNQKDYERIWNYIHANPARWTEDCFFCPQPDQSPNPSGGVMTPPYEKEE